MANITMRIGRNGEVTYRIRVYAGEDINGKPIMESTTYKPIATTQRAIAKEVTEYANNFERMVKDEGIVDAERTSFTDMVEIWKRNWLPAKTLSVQENYEDGSIYDC